MIFTFLRLVLSVVNVQRRQKLEAATAGDGGFVSLPSM